MLLLAIIALPLIAQGKLQITKVADRATLPPTLLPAIDNSLQPTQEPSLAPVSAPAPSDTVSNAQAELVISQFTTLKQGDDNASVGKLQQRLMELGYLDGDMPSNSFSAVLEEAVKRFQRACSLDQNGIADEALQTLLYSKDAPYYRIKESDAGRDVLNMQERLGELGYYTGYQNGYYGPMTAQAVMAFQSNHNLYADGVLDYGDWELLFSYEAEQGHASPRTPKPTHKEEDASHEPKTTPRISPKTTPKGTAKATPKTTPKATAKATAKTTPKQSSASASTPKATSASTAVSTQEAPAYTPDPTAPEAGVTTAPEVTADPQSQGPAEGEPVVEDTPLSTQTPKPTATPKPTDTPKPVDSGGEKSYSCSASGLCDAARDQMGKPYVWGDRGPDSFDCSGMVYYCMKSCGLNVSRRSSYSYADNTAWTLVESISDLKAGDLLFFKSDDKDKVSHTGIYVGGGSFIHASSSSGKVIKSSISTSYWTRNFVCGRRVF